MASTPTRSIQSALSMATTLGKTVSVNAVASKVRSTLTRDGWKVVKARKVERLEEVLNEIYVDNRRARQVELLEEARKIAQSL